jgi:hypothetical protein
MMQTDITSTDQGSDRPLAIAGRFLHAAPVDVVAMAAELGLGVDLGAELPPEMSGRIRRGGINRAGYHIEVNRAHSANRKRFTLAHEIAHYLLHRDLIGDGIEDSALYRSRLSDEIEIEANRLAAHILMPAALVKNIFRAGLRYVAGLSAAFQVSEDAMRIRLRQLRLAP